MKNLINWFRSLFKPTIPKISPELKQFFQEWDEWRVNGAMDHPTFRRHGGLCYNLKRWSVHLMSKNFGINDELRSLFKSPYPFGQSVFYSDLMEHTMHLDKNRIAFVKQFLETEK